MIYTARDLKAMPPHLRKPLIAALRDRFEPIYRDAVKRVSDVAIRDVLTSVVAVLESDEAHNAAREAGLSDAEWKHENWRMIVGYIIAKFQEAHLPDLAIDDDGTIMVQAGEVVSVGEGSPIPGGAILTELRDGESVHDALIRAMRARFPDADMTITSRDVAEATVELRPRRNG